MTTKSDDTETLIREEIGPDGLPVWLTPEGTPVSCLEKIKVLNENILEIREMCQEALEDAVLMGCDERQIRAVLMHLIRSLEEPFKD